jgi:exodeoxyribonuclease VII small subunit
MFNLEKGLEELEELVSRMENNILSVQSALNYYEKGIKLVNKCEETLQKAEQKIKILKEKNGKETLSDYSESEEYDNK